MRKKSVWGIVSAVLMVLALVCIGVVGWYFYDWYQSEKAYKELRNEVIDTEGETETQETQTEVTLEEILQAEFTGEIEGAAPRMPENVLSVAENHEVDFAKLQEINPELYAWIYIPETVIDYPIAQHEGQDQSFYLHHNLYQEPQFAGCIYSETFNSKDFNDPVTVLYGHNMKNGSMFQNLHKFRDKDFFEKNSYVYVYTPDTTYVYEIYAAYTWENKHILQSYDMSDEEVFAEYLKETQNPRSMEVLEREGVTLTTEDRILTLSTCIGNQPEQRLIVQAVLKYEENGNE